MHEGYAGVAPVARENRLNLAITYFFSISVLSIFQSHVGLKIGALWCGKIIKLLFRHCVQYTGLVIKACSFCKQQLGIDRQNNRV